MDESVIVSCPACTTRFSLDAALLGESGRTVRCAKCAHKWKQLPPKAEAAETEIALAAAESAPLPPAPESVAPPQPESATEPAADIPAAPPRPRSPQRPVGPITVPPKLRPIAPKKRSLLWPITLLIVGLVAGLLGTAYFLRAEIARAVPAFDMAYGLMGISTSNPATDLDIGNLKFDRRNTDGKSAISIQGDIFNKSEFPVRLPNLVAIPTTKDENDQVINLEPWHPFRLEQQVIEPGETITFSTFIENLPEGTKSIKVTFLE